MVSSLHLPSLEFVADIASRVLSSPVTSITRFSTGMANWVYDVIAQDGTSVVVRIHRSARDCEAAIHWSQTLRPLGVPLPTLLAHHVEEAELRSWMILTRLPGTDLGAAYPTLTLEQKCRLARQIVTIQRRVATLPAGGGYGFVSFPHDWPHPTWLAVVQGELGRARRRIREAAALHERVVDTVEARVEEFSTYFSRVAPIPFLDDTTTKNVIIHQGELSGVVDVDCVCYGDPLYTIGLTRMSLLNLGVDTDYTDQWLDVLQATPEQRRAVCFYTAVFCVNFLSEQGQQFNQDCVPTANRETVARLEEILGRLLVEI